MALKLDKSKMVKSLVRRTKFVHHLDRYIEKTGDFVWSFEYSPKIEDGGWHPSSHCMASPAELYDYALEQGPKLPCHPPENPIMGPSSQKHTAQLYKTFMVGHFWHQYLQEVTVRAGLAPKSAVERSGEKGWGQCVHSGPKKHYAHWHFCTGSGDLAPVTVPIHGDYLVDFKTMGSHIFKPNIPYGDTLEKWECQMNIYMDLFDLERALVVGINKDTPHDLKEYEFHRNQALVDAIYEKWKLVSLCLEEEVQPPSDEVIDLPFDGPVEQ